MATPVGDSYTCVSGGKIAAGRFAQPAGVYTGVIAVSLQGAADPFAASPPAALQVYPVGFLSAGAGAKHQAWTFDSDHNDMIIGGGDTFTNSRPDFYAYSPTTRLFSKIINAEDLGAETWNDSIYVASVTNGGSGYPAGVSVYYPNYSGLPGIPMTGGTGAGASCSVHTSGGVVDGVQMVTTGYGYTVGDVLTVNNSYLGGSGSGLQVTVLDVIGSSTPSTTISPEGRCLPGIAYDNTRHVMWLEGGQPRRGWSDNLKKGGLWALDRNATPPTWHLQGPSVCESGLITMLYNEYSMGLIYDEVGQALYTIYFGTVFKYSLAGVTIDDVYRNNWTSFALPATFTAYNGYPAFDTLRRRIVFYNEAESATYVWNCATDTYAKLTPTFAPVWDNWWHFDYDETTDRVICWTAASLDGFGDPSYVLKDYTGARIHWMYSMVPDGTWTQFTPAGDKLIQDDVWHVQMSGGYDRYHKCMVIITSQQAGMDYDIGVTPERTTIHHLLSPVAPTLPDGFPTVPRTWALVGDNTLSDLNPSNDPAVNPNYPSAAPWWGSNGHGSIITAWCSGAWDETLRKLFITGGGHADYGGNEVYAWDAVTSTFFRLNNPTGAIGNTGNLNDGLDATVPTLFDGQPRAAHNYGNLRVVNGEFWNFQGSTWYSGFGVISAFKWTGTSWVRQTTRTWPECYGMTVWDSTRQRFVIISSGNAQPQWWKPSDDTIGSFTGYSYNSSGVNGDYDPLRDIILQFSTNITCLKADGSVDAVTITATGTAPNWATYLPQGHASGAGIVRDAVNDRWLIWGSGTSIYVLTPPPVGQNPLTATWVWSKIDADAGNAVTPTAPTSNGTFGRFWYSPSMKCCGVVNSVTQKMYVFRIE